MTVLPTLFASQQQGDLPLHEQLVRTLREAILAGRFEDEAARIEAGWAGGAAETAAAPGADPIPDPAGELPAAKAGTFDGVGCWETVTMQQVGGRDAAWLSVNSISTATGHGRGQRRTLRGTCWAYRLRWWS